MTAFIGLGLLTQTALVLTDLYFVSHLGARAMAGVSAAATTLFLGMATAQIISIGALSLLSQSFGARDFANARLVFSQACALGCMAGVCALALGYSLGPLAVNALSADASTSAAGRAYLFALTPGLACMFPAAALSAGLRAGGMVGAPMLAQSLTVAVNIALAPLLIGGWGYGLNLGPAGAGLATSIATIAGVGALSAVFYARQPHLRLSRSDMTLHWRVIGRLAKIGLPAGGEFAVAFVITGFVYGVLREFGPATQAGYGVGSRVMQAVFVPAMALALGVAPIAGQNYGAGYGHRVRETLHHALLMGGSLMLALTLVCQVSPDILVRPFTSDHRTAAVAAGYLRILSWHFIASGVILICTGVFQALSQTLLPCSAARAG